MLIVGRLLHVVNDENFDGSFLRLEFEAECLHRCEDADGVGVGHDTIRADVGEEIVDAILG